MDLLYKSNKQVQRVDKSEFINDACSTEIDLKKATKQWFEKNKKDPLALNKRDSIFTTLDYPWLFNLVSKVDILQFESKLSQSSEQLDLINQIQQGGVMNINSLMNLNMGSFYLTIKVRRSHILDDALSQISSTKNLKKP